MERHVVLSLCTGHIKAAILKKRGTDEEMPPVMLTAKVFFLFNLKPIQCRESLLCF